jgi:small subunit ribosomal protein S8
MKHDPLADAFAIIKNTEGIGRRECTVPASKVIRGVMEVMKKRDYIGEFRFIEDGKGGHIKLKLLGRVNDCGVIKPRFSVTSREMIRWEKQFLPADGIGILILTTSKGIMNQADAVKHRTGGKLLGYVY